MIPTLDVGTQSLKARVFKDGIAIAGESVIFDDELPEFGSSSGLRFLQGDWPI